MSSFCYYTVDITIVLTTSGASTAGEVYSLECSVNTTDSSSNQSTIDITWLNPMNDRVPSGMVSTVGNTSTLTFNPLAASDAGTYTCRVGAGSTIQNATTSITVESKSFYRDDYGTIIICYYYDI